jgi:hypothetical protein
MVRVCFTVLALLVALPAWAQQLNLDIRDGLVTLSATNVPVRQVLAEWARVGGTRVVGAERISGSPLTLSLEGVPEAKALDIVLRGAAGYMAAARSVPGAGRSMYDRILVLATSTPPAGGPSAGGAANRPAANRLGVPPPVESPAQPDVVAEMPEMTDQSQVNPFANAFGQAGAAAPFGQMQPGQVNPFGQPIGQPGQPFPQGGFFQPLQPAQGAPGAPPASGGFFSMPGAATPGMVQQPAQPPAPPGVRPRPQG